MEPARSALYRGFLATSSVALLLAALFLRLPALAALGTAWLVLLAVARLRAGRPLEAVTVRRELYPSAFEDDEVGVDLVLESRRPVRMVEIADRFGPALAAEQRLLEPGPLVPGFRRRLRYESWCSRQWGAYPVGPLSVTAHDPLGLASATRAIPDVQEFSVFPRVHPVQALARLGVRPTMAPVDDPGGRPGQSTLFLGVRDYRPGDDPRHVHWPATARRGALVTKVYEVDRVPYTTVLLDLDRRHRAGTGRKSTLEYLVRSACSVVWTASAGEGFVQAVGEGARSLFVPPGRGEAHFTRACHELLRASQDGAAPFHQVVADWIPRIPPASSVVLISGTPFLELGPWGEIAGALQAKACRVLVLVVNTFSFPPISGWPPPRVEVVERMRESVFFLQSRGVQVQVLEEADDLAAALGRGTGS